MCWLGRRAGKTTAMNALRRAWETSYGAGSVIGLAPSAVAAQVLADDLGIATKNTAKWWTTHLHIGATFHAGQLAIIDETLLVDTLSLDRITQAAAEAGATVLLAGDYAQLQSMDAGGAASLLIPGRDDAPELVDVYPSTHDWEKTASLELRHDRTPAIDTYVTYDPIHDGDAEAMPDAAYTAWLYDRQQGSASVLIAEPRENVTALSVRARADLILDCTLKPCPEITLSDGSAAGVGDTISTRRNDRRLRNLHSWVRYGQTWTISQIRSDGSVTIRAPGARFGNSIVLPAEYVAEHVDLAYAVTARCAEGITSDTAHILVEPTTTRENLYVTMTRGRESNRAYLILDRPDDHAITHPGDDPAATARTLIFGARGHHRRAGAVGLDRPTRRRIRNHRCCISTRPLGRAHPHQRPDYRPSAYRPTPTPSAR